jgi:hypothetical protein
MHMLRIITLSADNNFSSTSTLGAFDAPFGSPNTSEVEDDLVAVMHRLDVQVLASLDSRPVQTHASLASFTTKAAVSMPSAFLSISQARSYRELITRRTLHFLAASLRSGGNTSAALMLQGPTMAFPEAMTIPIGVNLFAQPPNQQGGQERERAELAAEIEAWNCAYAPI